MRILLAFCLATLPLVSQDEKEVDKAKSKFIGDLAAIEAGRVLFASGCAACHGADALGGRGPNLRERVFWHPVDDETLFKAIQKGLPGGMPPANLSEDQTWQVVAYVRSLTAPAIENKAPGDAKWRGAIRDLDAQLIAFAWTLPATPGDSRDRHHVLA